MPDKFKYSDHYKKQAVKRLEDIQKQKTFLEKLEKEVKQEIQQEYKKVETIVEDNIKEGSEKIKEIEHYVKEPSHIKILKILVVLIALSIIGYLVYSNFFSSQDFNYFYDIGSEKDSARIYLTPADRITDVINDTDSNYRNLTSQLVYFDFPVPANSETINIQVRFKDNFPNNSKMSFGARDQVDWHYVYNQIFTQKNENATGEWIVIQTEFEISQDSLVIQNQKLSMLFNIPHLSPNQNQTNNMSVPVDWINITVHKPGLFEKWGWIK